MYFILLSMTLLICALTVTLYHSLAEVGPMIVPVGNELQPEGLSILQIAAAGLGFPYVFFAAMMPFAIMSWDAHKVDRTLFFYMWLFTFFRKKQQDDVRKWIENLDAC